MRRLRLIALAVLTVILTGSVAAGIGLPGPHRMACPSCYGLEHIGDGIFADAAMTPAQRTFALEAIARGRAVVREFYGELRSAPRIVICRTRKCSSVFGSRGAKGVTYAWHAILLSWSRILDVIAAHEVAHAEIHWRMGYVGWLKGAVPAWFDEGLAVVISQDPRFRRDVPAAAVREIMGITSFAGQWSAHAEHVGWQTAYGAAATRVRQLQRRIGNEGLRRFVLKLVREGRIEELIAKAEREGRKF